MPQCWCRAHDTTSTRCHLPCCHLSREHLHRVEQDHRFNAITAPEHGHTTPGGDTYPGYHLLVEHLFKRGTQQALLHVRMFDIDKWADLKQTS